MTDLNQSSPTAETEVLKVTQGDADEAFLNFNGQVGQGNSIDSYTTKNAAKSGTIKIYYTNAETGLKMPGYIDIKAGPD